MRTARSPFLVVAVAAAILLGMGHPLAGFVAAAGSAALWCRWLETHTPPEAEQGIRNS